MIKDGYDVYVSIINNTDDALALSDLIVDGLYIRFNQSNESQTDFISPQGFKPGVSLDYFDSKIDNTIKHDYDRFSEREFIEDLGAELDLRIGLCAYTFNKDILSEVNIMHIESFQL